MLVGKVRDHFSPYNGEYIGERIVVAVDNTAGKNGDPAFRKPFIVYESGDFTTPIPPIRYNEVADLLDEDIVWLA